MNRLILTCAAALAILAVKAQDGPKAFFGVENKLDFDRTEIVEIDYQKAAAAVGSQNLAVVDLQGKVYPSQVTHDGKLIALVDAHADATTPYAIRQADNDEKADTVACGKVYPWRDDDIAWENDKVAFRAYGPKIQRKGEKMYGYDLFLKRNTSEPILESLYQAQCSGENWRKVNDLRAQGKNEEADIFVNSFTYHVDHGYGMDCYAVGATLGAGTSAFVDMDGIIFPWCYAQAEILDNGPLRFTARLTYHPMAVGGDTVVEHRIITLDAGSHLNRTVVSYSGLTKEMPYVTGIAVREDGSPEHLPTGKVCGKSENRYISYIDPTQGPDNGELYVGAVFPFEPMSVAMMGPNPYHLAALSTYAPGQDYVYYWGYGWNRSDVPSFEAWNEYLDRQAKALQSPLAITNSTF